MDQEAILRIKDQLQERKSELLRLIKEQQEEMGVIQSTRSPDWLDLTTATENIHLLMTLGDNERRELDDIEIALGKIDDGTYGECEACGRKIKSARLEALMTARLCKKCKDEEEATLKPTSPDYNIGWRAIEQDPTLLAGAGEEEQDE
ncbi:MAG: TraR/DksA family transcriptional regulator [Candidatus Eisenbacteria bacterium]|jgi:DnaK suppressor protein|nr:TraR/DksA family transcriptional regulator [Candidatus Eisenbacteria bacterium]